MGQHITSIARCGDELSKNENMITTSTIPDYASVTSVISDDISVMCASSKHANARSLKTCECTNVRPLKTCECTNVRPWKIHGRTDARLRKTHGCISTRPWKTRGHVKLETYLMSKSNINWTRVHPYQSSMHQAIDAIMHMINHNIINLSIDLEHTYEHLEDFNDEMDINDDELDSTYDDLVNKPEIIRTLIPYIPDLYRYLPHMISTDFDIMLIIAVKIPQCSHMLVNRLTAFKWSSSFSLNTNTFSNVQLSLNILCKLPSLSSAIEKFESIHGPLTYGCRTGSNFDSRVGTLKGFLNIGLPEIENHEDRTRLLYEIRHIIRLMELCKMVRSGNSYVELWPEKLIYGNFIHELVMSH